MDVTSIFKNTRFRRTGLVAGALVATLLGATGVTVGSPEHPLNLKQLPVEPHLGTRIQAQPKARRHRWYEIGRASWYGKLFQGKETASGEDFNMNALTCAHRSLPLGSFVKVTNLRNHKSVIVRVNDRGPVAHSRIVDLSYAAARLLGFSHKGTTKVRLDLVAPTAHLAKMTYPAAAAAH